MALQVSNNDFDGSLARYRELKASGVDYPYFHSVVGTAYLAKDDFSNATIQFDELLRREKSLHGRVLFRVAKDHLADVALYQGKFRSAKSQVKQAMDVSESPDERAVYAIELAEIVALEGSANDVRDLVRKDDMEQSTLATTRIAAAEVLATVGLKEEVNRLLAPIYRDNSAVKRTRAAELEFITGSLELAEGKNDEGTRALNNSYALDKTNLETAYFLARAYMKAGDWETASGLFESVVQNKGSVLLDYNAYIWPLALYYLAECEERLGEHDKALEEYESFLQLWKDADPELAEPKLAQRRYKELQTTLQRRSLPR
jgi:tetratricopeptide (TPR) repeat protein